MYLAIKKVQPVSNYKLILTFENGEKRLFDMNRYLKTGIFQELQDINIFNTVRVSFDSIEWDNEADLDPEKLYNESKLLDTKLTNLLIEITKAKYIVDYKIELEFNNGEEYVVDHGNELNGTIFQALKDKNNFKQFSIKFNTIEWDNGADLAPEYLYDLAKCQNQIASEPTSEYKTNTNNVQTWHAATLQNFQHIN